MLTTTPHKVIVAVFASVLLIGIAFGKFGTSSSLAEQVEQTAAAMFAPSVTATKTDALAPTANNADGKADPGDTIAYTVTIANGGPDSATGVTYNDTIDPNTTLSGAAAASSVAVDDTFPVTVTGNVSINSANLSGGPYSVTTNDYLGQNPVSTISAFDATTANGGQIAMTTSGAGMGQFTYDPPAGFEGTDTFTYTLSDNAAATSAASNRTATVSITVSGMVWFIDNNAAACTTANNDCGRLSKPYSSLAAFQAENGDADLPASDFFYPAANDNIFIYESSTAYTGGVTLLTGQKLIGQDATASLQTITGLNPPPGSAGLPSMGPGNGVSPTITNTNPNGNGVTLSTNNNLLRGFTVGDTGGYDIANTTTATVGNLTVLEVPLTGTGGLFRADSGGTLNVTFPTMSSTNATANGILLNGVSGTFASPGGITITNPGGTGIGIFSTTASYTFGGTTAVTGSGNANADTNGTGVHLTNNTGAFQFGTLNVSPDSDERAFYALTNTNTLTVTSGAISSTNGTGVEIRGTSAASRTPINVTFTSVSTTGGAQAVNGIFLKWTSDAGAGFTVTGNGGTCTLATPACTGGRITNTGGADNTTNGIGVYLEDVADVNLTRVRLDGHANGAIRGRTVTNFQFLNSLVDGNNGTCDAFCDDDPTDSQHGEDAVRFTNLLGSGLIDSSTIAGGWSNNLRVVNTTGTLNRLTIDNNFIGDPDAVGSGQRGLADLGEGNDGVQLHARDGITAMNVTVTNNTINYGVGDVLNILNNDNTAPVGTVDAIVRNNTLVNALSFDNAPCPLCQATGASNLTLAGLGHMTYDISCNKLGNSKGIQLNVFKGHNSAGTPSGNFTGTIYNNTLGLAGVPRSGGADGASALNVDQQGTGTGTVLIKNNVIRQYTEAGIRINNIDNLGQLSTLNATVIGNTTTEPVLVGGGPAFAGLYVLGGADSGTDFNQVTNIRVGSATVAAEKNNFNDASGSTTDAHIEETTGTVNLSRAGSAGPDGDAVIVDDNIVDPAGVYVNPAIALVNTTPALPPAISDVCSPPARPEGEETYVVPDRIAPDIRLTHEELKERLRRAIENRQTNEKVLGRFKYEVQKQADDQRTDTPEPEQVGSIGGDGDFVAASIGGSVEDVAEATETASWWNILTRGAHSVATLISPTVYAEEAPLTAAPFSGETVSVGPIATLPAGKSVVITFSVTVDPLDAGEIRTRIVNQGTASWTGVGSPGSTNTTDPTPNVDPACTASPSIGTGTCTPVDRPDTSVTSVTRVATTPTNAASVQWTVTFASAIAGLSASNLTLNDSAGPCAGESITSVTGVGGGPDFSQYTVTVNTGTGDCTLRLDVANDGGISHDLTNDPFTGGDTITIDKTPPTVLSINRASANPTNAASVDYTVTFSEAVSGVDPTDFLATMSGVTGVSSTTVTGGPTIYTVSVNTGTGDGSFRIDLSDNDSIVDAAGNPLGGPGNNNGSLSGQTYNVDKTPPAVDIVDVTPDPRNTAVSSITINFTESVTGFDLADLTLSRDGGANLLTGAQTITGGPMSYTLNNLSGITGTDGTYVLTITAPGGIADTAANNLLVGASEQWVMDTSKPNVTINQAAGQPDPAFVQPINFTVVFNEPVTDFDDAADIDTSASTTPGVLTATITQIAPNDGTTYNVAVSGATSDGTVVATVTNGAAADGAGNTSNPSTSTDNSVVFVTCAPPPANMRAWYTGDGTPADIAGGINGTLQNGAAYGAGKVGQAFDFNTASAVVTAPGNTGLNITGNQLTMDGWIYPRSNVSGTFYFAKSATSDHPFVLYNVAGDIHGIIRTPVNNFEFDTNISPAVNTWTHIALVYDSTQATASDRVKIYINGTAATLTAAGGFPAQNSNLASSGLPFAIGNRATNPGPSFNGLIDEVEVFNRALAESEIDAIVAADSGGKCKPSDLSVTKTDGGVTTTPGQTITYTFNYANAGKAATGVTLTENVPVNTTFNAAGSTAGWSCADGAPAGTACTFTVGSVASLGTGSAQFAATVVNPLPAGITDIGNAVTIADDGANGTELDTNDNVATDFTPVTAQPDFSLTKSEGGGSATPGQTIIYSLGITNSGNQDATGVALTETVPANTTFNAGSSSPGWSCLPNGNAGSTCTLAVGNLGGGNSSTPRAFAVTVNSTVPAGVTEISNTASVTDNGANGADPTPVNNASDTTPVNAQPDLTIAKSDGNTSTIPGGTVAYTLNYSNAGNQGATGVVLSETVPANTTFNAGSSTAGWNCTPNGNAGSTCTLAVGSLAAGANGSATFAVTVNTTGLSGVTQISNTASVADDGANGVDPTLPNTSTDTTPRNCQAITVNNPSNATGLIGTSFSETFTQTGGFGTISFSTASALPNGVTLSSAGVLSGTPSETGAFPIVVTVTDGNGCTGASATYNLNITCNVNPVVQNSNDSGVDSLRYAVATACSAAGQNTVTFNSGAGFVTSPISLSSGQIIVTRDVNIQGPGANLLTVQNTAPTSPTSRVFFINSGATVQISGLTVSGGNTTVDPTSNGGGGIWIDGSATLLRLTVTGNTSNNAGGGIVVANAGVLNLNESTVSGNTSTSNNGGGLQVSNTGSATVTNSTISGNSAQIGGGIRVVGTASLVLSNSTVTNNSATSGAGGVSKAAGAGTATVRSSIVAANQNNITIPDVSGAFISQGYNLIGNAGSGTGFSQPTDQVGSAAAVLNPQLLPLANNGGPTQTHALCVAAGVPGVSCSGLSPAIDKGDDLIGTGFDQRGSGPIFVRPYDLPDGQFPDAAGGDASDIGAYELNNTPPTINAAATSRQRGSAVVNSTIANVIDIESGNGGVAVKVNNGTSATVNGVTVSNIVNTNGTITADVVATCTATDAAFTLTATDTGALSTDATLNVAVTLNSVPVLAYNTPGAVVFGQTGVAVNPASGPSDNGSVASTTLESKGGFAGTVTVHPTNGTVTLGSAGPVGTHTITIRTTDNCGASVLSSFDVTVNKAATATTVSSSPSSSTYGQSVNLSATVATTGPGAGTPAGSVTFRDGGADCSTGTAIGSATLNGVGQASIAVSSLAAGPHTIRACYGGSGSHLASSATAAHTVDKAVLTVTASSHTVTYGDAVPSVTSNITGFVLGETSAVLTTQPTCTTTYTQGSGVAGAPYVTSCSSGGAANYAFNYINGTVSVNKAQLTVTADNKSRVYGQPNPAFTATIGGFVLGQTLATSGVTGSPALTTVATQFSPPGPYAITAALGSLASANYSFAFAPGVLNVGQAATTVAITNGSALASAQTNVGQAYTVQFAVAPVAPGSGAPTGIVTVSDGTGAECTAALAAGSNGVGSCSLTSLTAGDKAISVSYAGDTNFTGSTAAAGAPHRVVILISGTLRQYIAGPGPDVALPGITVALEVDGAPAGASVSDASGQYAFALLTNGADVRIVPDRPGKLFDPISRSYANVTDNIPTADFVAYDRDGPNFNPREVRVVDAGPVAPGQPVSVPVEISSLGDETSFTFSLAFDPATMGPPSSIACGSAFAQCTVAPFDIATPGRVGITVTRAVPPDAGVGELIRVTFPTNANAAVGVPSAITFGDAPAVRTIVNAEGNPVPAVYRGGSVTFTSTPAPTFSISGRVLTPEGAGLRNARVRLVAADGSVRVATTGSFGLYTFASLPPGQHTLTVVPRRYRFAPRTVTVADADLAGIDLVGLQ